MSLPEQLMDDLEGAARMLEVGMAHLETSFFPEDQLPDRPDDTFASPAFVREDLGGGADTGETRVNPSPVSPPLSSPLSPPGGAVLRPVMPPPAFPSPPRQHEKVAPVEGGERGGGVDGDEESRIERTPSSEANKSNLWMAKAR